MAYKIRNESERTRIPEDHPFSKFALGDKVRFRDDGDIKHQAPSHLDFTSSERARPRTIIAIRYDRAKQCNFYKLGSNGRGKMCDGQPLEGFDYWFRSYQLIAYIPRQYHFKRAYNRKNVFGTDKPSNPNPDLVSATPLIMLPKQPCC